MKKILVILIGLIYSWQLSAQDTCQPSARYAAQKVVLLGQEIRYLDEGKGPVIVLIHGLGGNAGHWAMNIDNLVALGYRVLALNLPGYGGSTADTSVRQGRHLDYYASTVSAWATHMGLKKVTLAGHSMGGQVAMLVALGKPRWLARLVLVAPAGLETFSEQEAGILKNFATPAYYMGQNDKAIREAWQRNFYKMPATAEVLVQERQALRHCSNFANYCQTIVHGVWGMLEAPVAHRMHLIQVPVLVLAGQQDGLIPNKLLHPALTMPDLLAKVSAALPKAQTRLVPDAGHLLQWEAAEVFHKAIHSFIHQ